MQLKNKVFLITGAGSGLGAAVARMAVGAGARVALLDVNAGAGQALRKGALAAVQRPGDKDHNSPPHWQAHSAASIHSSAFCKNHPARSPVMPPNCLSETT